MPQQRSAASPYDRLVIVIVQDQDSGRFSDALNEAGFTHTRIRSAGGFLQVSNAMFLIGMEGTRFNSLAAIIQDACKTRTELVSLPWNVDVDYVEPVEVKVGGATVLALDLDRVELL